MLLGQLFHTAIRTADLNATTRFYLEVLGMILAERPPINFPGVWIRPPTPGGDAIFHIYAGDAAKEPDGSVLSGAGAIDHISVQAQGYSQFRERFKKFNLQWRENLVPATALWQLFIYDPNGILLELTFHQAAEDELVPVIAKERQYVARERWFKPELYRQFAAPAPQLDKATERSA
jgi:catechol 2,3-dioxygenase-like lactoylglutathione lyase family enzyme